MLGCRSDFASCKKSGRSSARKWTGPGAIELLMPTLQLADLWRETGRYEAYGPEMLQIKDRHERELLYGPTNEDMITGIFGAYVLPTGICQKSFTISSGNSATSKGRASASCAAAST